MTDLHVAILAAGKGTRMKSARPKVLHHVAGRPMIDYVMQAAQSLSPRTTTLVVGHMKELLRQGLGNYPDLAFVTQEPQLGTGHALLQTAGVLEGQSGFVLLLSGDVPLLKRHTLAELVRKHQETNAAATVLTALVDAAVRIRSCRTREGTHLAHRRGAGRVAGAAEDQGNQQRCLCVFACAAVRGTARSGHCQRAGRVLFDGSDFDVSPAPACSRDSRARGSRTRSAASTAGRNWQKRAES